MLPKGEIDRRGTKEESLDLVEESLKEDRPKNSQKNEGEEVSENHLKIEENMNKMNRFKKIDWLKRVQEVGYQTLENRLIIK